MQTDINEYLIMKWNLFMICHWSFVFLTRGVKEGSLTPL